MTRRRADLTREQQLHVVMARLGSALFREAVLDDGELVDLGDEAAIAGYHPRPAVWVDGEDASVLIGEAGRSEGCACGDPECPGWVVRYDLLAIVVVHEGRWWWNAAGLGHTTEVPEETRADARLATERAYAKASG